MNFYHLRIARPVTHLNKSCEMYCRGLNLKKIGSFENHSGFSGYMLGRADIPWHLEFTVCLEHPISPAASAEDLLVLYIPDNIEWQTVCDSMIEAGFSSIPAFNSYWDNHGRTFIDHDGYRTVIQHQAWKS